MLILETNQIPATTAQLIDVVERSIRKWIRVPESGQLVTAAGKLPKLSSATVNLSGGTADSSKGVPEYNLAPATEAGPTIAGARVIASPLTIDGVAFDFDLTASNLAFGYARSDSGQLVVTLEAGDGELSFELTKPNLEAAILKAARTAAGKLVEILKVDATLGSISPRVLDVNLKITARKIVTAVIRITGRLSVDDELNATATSFKAEGDGMVGKFAVNFLRPHLDKLQRQPLSLMHVSLGKVRLRDVAVNADDGLRITAKFGNT